MGISKSLGPLAMYVDAEEGVSFQTDNELYICSYCNGRQYQIQAKEMKDHSSKFHISLLPSGKVLLQDFRNMYVCWTDHEDTNFLTAERSTPDSYCEFEVFTEGEKVVFKASNGHFVCRTFRYQGDLMEANSYTIEDCCRLRTGMGDVYVPSLDISKIVLSDDSNFTCKPCMVKKETFVNKSDNVQSHTFTLTWDVQTTESTHWETTWGLNAICSCPFKLKGVSVNATYNGHFQKVAITNRQILEKRSITVNVPQRRKVTAMLVVSKIDNAVVPFTAMIRKTKVSGEAVYFEEKGVWKGLVYDDVIMETKEEPAWDLFFCQIL